MLCWSIPKNIWGKQKRWFWASSLEKIECSAANMFPHHDLHIPWFLGNWLGIPKSELTPSKGLDLFLRRVFFLDLQPPQLWDPMILREDNFGGTIRDSLTKLTKHFEDNSLSTPGLRSRFEGHVSHQKTLGYFPLNRWCLIGSLTIYSALL